MDVVYKSEALAKPEMDLCTFHAHHPSTKEVDTGISGPGVRGFSLLRRS